MNFGGFTEEFTDLEKSKVVIVPVPYDETSTWIKGADKGPDAILDASANMELYDIESDCEIFEKGIHTANAVSEKSSPDKMVDAVYKEVSKYLNKDKFTVLIGGEHSVSIGSIKAFAEKYSDLTILQLDAHGDLRQEYEETIYNHACVMARARELCPIIQVGIRSMSIEEREFADKDRVFFAHQIYNNTNWMDKALSKLTKNVYITIDLDVFDPSIMPSTGTPEPGGLLWYDVLNFLKKVNQKANIVGFDVVELCPNIHSKGSDFLASKLIYQILNYKFSK